MSFIPESFGHHAEILKSEVDTVDYLSLLLPCDLDDNQIGVARMMIRHAFRSGFVLESELSNEDVAYFISTSLEMQYDIPADQILSTANSPEVSELVGLAYLQGGRIKNG